MTPEAYVEPCQTPKIESFAKLFSRYAPSYMYNRTLKTPQHSKLELFSWEVMKLVLRSLLTFKWTRRNNLTGCFLNKFEMTKAHFTSSIWIVTNVSCDIRKPTLFLRRHFRSRELGTEKIDHYVLVKGTEESLTLILFISFKMLW